MQPGNFWELSNAVLDHIEGTNYAENKCVHILESVVTFQIEF